MKPTDSPPVMQRDDKEAPATIGTSAKKSGGMLLRLFQSECFDSYYHMFYLYHREEQGVHDYLVNLLYRRPDVEIHFYLPQLCQIAISRAKSALSRFLLDKSANSMHLALKGSWMFQAALEDRIPVISEAAAKMREETEMAVVNSKPVNARDHLVPAEAPPSFNTAFNGTHHPAHDLFLRRRVVRALMRGRGQERQIAVSFIDRAVSLLTQYYPPACDDASAQQSPSPVPVDHSPDPSGGLILSPLVVVPPIHLIPASPGVSPSPAPSTSLAPSYSTPNLEVTVRPPLRGENFSSPNIPPSVPDIKVGRPTSGRKKGRVAAGFVTHSEAISVAGSRVKLPSVYGKLGTPFNYTSFSRESHGVLLEDSEMQQFIIKQRRCEYFNLVGLFISLIIEVSDKLCQESDKSLRTPLLRAFTRAVDEWILCRRCVVAASEGMFAMTGLAIPFTNYGVEPEHNPAAAPGVPTPFSLQASTPSSQFSSRQMLRVTTEGCRVFSSKKRAPYLFLFELADLDEDLRDIDVSRLKQVSQAVEEKDGRARRLSEMTDPGLTWESLHVYTAILNDLKIRQLYIPQFSNRPLTTAELCRIAASETHSRYCSQCTVKAQAGGAARAENEGVETGVDSDDQEKNSFFIHDPGFPFQCRHCGGTAVFHESVMRDQILMSLRRSLGVPERLSSISEVPRKIPNVPVYRGAAAGSPPPRTGWPARSPPLSPSGLEAAEPLASEPLSQRDNSAVAEGQAQNRGRQSHPRRSSSFSPKGRQAEWAGGPQMAAGVESAAGLGKKSSGGPGASGLPSIANMLTFVKQGGGSGSSMAVSQQSRLSSPAKPSTPSLSKSVSRASESPGPPAAAAGVASEKAVAPELAVKGEGPREQAMRVRSIVWAEPWDRKKEQIRQASPYGFLKSWQLGAVIVKGGDDVRQELLASQLILQFKAIFDEAKLPLWLRPYEILVTGSQSGIMEYVPDTQSVDAVKKKFNVDSVAKVFDAAFADNIHLAKRNFIESHAAYSLVGYLLQVKDRHNGNVLLDNTGRIVHIDYGFMLSNSPGYVNFETSPFKLSSEIMAIMDGENSQNFEYFKELVIKGFLESRKHAERIFLVVEMMLSASKMPCFAGAPDAALTGLKERFMLGISDNQCVAKVLDLIELSINNWRTQQYDNFQRITNGIY